MVNQYCEDTLTVKYVFEFIPNRTHALVSIGVCTIGKNSASYSEGTRLKFTLS
jgi:hypothetical protein